MYRSRILCAFIFSIFLTNTGQASLDGWEEQSAGKSWSVQVVSDIVRKGSTAMRFEVRGGDERINPDSGKISFRAELSEKWVFRAKMGHDYWYGFSMYIPKDFPIHTNRLNIGQWHASPDTALGEVKRSPVLSQKYKRGKFYVNVRYSSLRVQKSNDSIKKRIFEIRKFQKGVWHDFVYHVKWSHGNDGFVDMWMDGTKAINYSGPVGYNDQTGPYFRYGIYRGDVPETYIVYYDEYRRGNNFEEVNPARNPPVD